MAEAGWWLVVLAGVAVGDGLLFWLGYTWHVRRQAAPDAVAEKLDPAALRQDIDRFNAALNAMQLCITGVEEKVGRLQDGVPARPSGGQPAAVMPHAPERHGEEPLPGPDAGLAEEVVRIAQRLARLGASAGELSRACGLLPGEAELISRLTRLGGAAEPSRPSAAGAETARACDARLASHRPQPSPAPATADPGSGPSSAGAGSPAVGSISPVSS